MLTVAQVFKLADLMPDHLRAVVLLATFASLRWGEIAALRRMDVDADAGTVSVRQAQVELDTGELLIGPPKSRAGVRTVALPRSILPALREHLDKYTGPEQTALVFTGKRGGNLRRANFRRATRWGDAVAEIGAPGLHFHDLRHTGNMLAADTGASLRDLMERLGHDSVRAAMIYQHKSAGGNRAIANAIDAEINNADQDGDGSTGALARTG